MNFIVKICGITTPEDAVAASAAGANALGLMFYPASKRYISRFTAAEICRVIPPGILKVGVFVNAGEAEIDQAVGELGLDIVQLHGSESPQFATGLRGARVMKAFQIANEQSLDALAGYRTDFWLLDSYLPGELGGTGKCFNWDLARRVSDLGRSFLLAGGLTPENVAEAIRVVRPNGVDVSSGVESSPGRKDPKKMQAFVQSALNAAKSPREWQNLSPA